MIPNHYCIQADRIEKMDKKVDDIHSEFQVNGIIGIMSGQIKKLTTMAENGKIKSDNSSISPKILYFVIAGLVVILAAVLGVKLPF
jgi:hypothetical protein